MSKKDFFKKLDSIRVKHKDVIAEATANAQIKKVSFDSPNLSYLFSGFSYNRIHQVYGPESAGKSSISAYIAGQLQKKLGSDKDVVIYLDFEKTFDPKYAANLGLDVSPEKFVLLQPMTIEEGFEIAFSLIQEKCVCCLIFDSDAMAPTAMELESEMNKANFGVGALAISRILKKCNGYIHRYSTPILWISQERVNMDYGAKLPSTTGGKSIKYACSTKTRITKKENIMKGDEQIGIVVKVKNYKNKTGVPGRVVEMNLYFNGGFKSDDEYTDYFIKLGMVKQAGAWISNEKYNLKVCGKSKFIDWLKLEENLEIYNNWKKEVDDVFSSFNETLDSNIDTSDLESDDITSDIEDFEEKQE